MLRFSTTAVLLAALALAAPAQAQVSGDGPFTWADLSEPVKPYETLFLDDGTLVALASDLWRLPPGSDTWEFVDAPNAIGGADAALALRGDTLIAGPLVRSYDGGRTWELVDTCADPTGCSRLDIRHSHAIEEITVGPYAGRLLAGGALYSDDRGASWYQAEVVDHPQDFRMYAFAGLPSGRVLGAGDFGAGYSDDGGETWRAVAGLNEPYVIAGRKVLRWATPGSAEAHAAGGPAPDCGLADAELCEGAVFMGNGADGGTVGQAEAWWTNDGGRTWALAGDLVQEVDGPGYPHVAVLSELDRAGTAPGGGAGAGRGLVVLGRGFVFRTLDGGATWEGVGRVAGMTEGVTRIALSGAVGPDGRLYVGAPRLGAADTPVAVTGEPASAALSYVVSAQDPAGAGGPERASLGVRVAPNPSSGAMRVELAGDGAAVAYVVDARGRRVAELWAGELRGATSVELSTEGWALGVYAVVVEAGGERTSARFTVAR